MNISYLGGREGWALALWGCLLYLMWKLLPWFWSWGNWGTSCDNVCYLIWHLWHTSDSFRRRGAAVNRLDCGTEICRNSCLIKTRLFLNSLFFCLRRLSLCLPLTVSCVCVWKETAACEERERDPCQKEHPDSMGSSPSSCQRVARALDLPLDTSAPPSHAGRREYVCQQKVF